MVHTARKELEKGKISASNDLRPLQQEIRGRLRNRDKSASNFGGRPISPTHIEKSKVLARNRRLDTSKIRSNIYRPIWKQFTWFLVLDFFLLMYVGAMPAEGLWILLGRIGTGYWFAYFLILAPVVGWLEKPQLVPEAIHLRNKK